MFKVASENFARFMNVPGMKLVRYTFKNDDALVDRDAVSVRLQIIISDD